MVKRLPSLLTPSTPKTSLSLSGLIFPPKHACNTLGKLLQICFKWFKTCLLVQKKQINTKSPSLLPQLWQIWDEGMGTKDMNKWEQGCDCPPKGSNSSNKFDVYAREMHLKQNTCYCGHSYFQIFLFEWSREIYLQRSFSKACHICRNDCKIRFEMYTRVLVITLWRHVIQAPYKECLSWAIKPIMVSKFWGHSPISS